MKAAFTFLTLFAALLADASAKAYYQTRDEMIDRAEVIAVVTITNIQDADAKGKTWTYRTAGDARAIRVLKGKLPAEFTLHGEETFICAQCPVTEGHFLAFLKKDGDLWTGSNWHLSLRPITGTDVEWYAESEDRYEMRPTALGSVVEHILARLAGGN